MARISGLVSGLDTDALIQELVAAYETKQESYVKKQTKLQWTQEAWKSLNSKVYSFYTGTLNTSRFSNAYSAKKATISDSTKATVSASSDAVIGTQSLKVKQLAKTAYLTGGEIQGKTKDDGTQTQLTANSKLSDIAGFSATGDVKIDVTTGNGKTTKTITANGDMSINAFVVKLKEAGVNASFDAENGRFFISGKESGSEGKFSLTAANAEGIDALKALGLSVTTAEDIANYAEIASDKNYVTRNADTQYVKTVLTEANAALEKEKAYLEDVLSYVKDPSTYETKNTEQKNQAKTSITELQTKIQAKMQDGTQNDDLKALFVQKKVDGENRYSLREDYLNADGSIKEEALNEAVKKAVKKAVGPVDTAGNVLADDAMKDEQKEKYDAAMSFVNEVNQYIEKTADYDATITELNDTLKKYRATAYEYANDTSKSGTVEQNLQAKIDSLQTSITDNTTAMSKTYNRAASINYTDAAGNAATITFADLKADDTNPTYKNLTQNYQNVFNAKTAALAEGNANITYQVVDGVGKLADKAGNSLSIDAEGYLTKSSGEYVTGFGTDGKAIYSADKKNAKTIAQLSTTVDENGNISTGGAVRVTGEDAVIELNGATFTSNTNNFSINGLTITATAETGDEAISVSTTTDIDGMYDSIKKLVNDYNEILKEMNTLYYADSSKGYEPLSDDEKEAMTDTEIEKWETKIKESLLRRDDTLSNIMTGFRNATSKFYTIGGKNYSLSTFGVSTSGYFSVENEERGLLHIDGNPDDAKSSGNPDKLKAALATDPDSVIQFFQKLADDLYSDVTKRMARTSLSSSYTLYNDKQMQSQYEDYDDIIADWDVKIEKYTDRYVKQFAAMEKAMAELQSSTSQMTGMMG